MNYTKKTKVTDTRMRKALVSTVMWLTDQEIKSYVNRFTSVYAYASPMCL